MYKSIKAIADTFIALLLLLGLSPFMLIIFFITGFFTQQRLGMGGRPFTIYKFKTMKQPSATLVEDKDRLTPFGKFLRKWSLDELPQLINVVKGQMSLVGPRPLPVQYNPLIKGEFRKRFDVKPGLTGLTQVRGRNLLSWKQKFELDKIYAENQSFKGDVKILLLTFGVVISARGVDASLNTTMEEFKGFDKE